MTKAELIERVALDTKVSKNAAERILNSITRNIAKCLKKKDKISLTGFGTFYLAKRKARQGRHPKTGKALEIAASRVAKFKMGKALKQSILALK